MTPGQHRLSADALQQGVQVDYPQAHVSKYLPPLNAQGSAQFVMQQEGRELNVFIDPYSGDILGEQDARNNVQAIARALHGELMIGKVGDRLIELAAGWGILLVVSGLYLWWPRGKSGSGVLWPRFKSRGRALWRDVHAVTGFWGALLLLLMLLSGMTWTGFWGKQFADDPRNDATLHIDQYTGKVLADVGWKDYSTVSRATEMGVMLHEGKFFGWINQLIIFLICLMVLLSAVSGLVIWWQRRPQGGLGVPPLRHDLPRWKTAIIIMIAVGVAFPLVGASLVGVYLLDRIARSRFAKFAAKT